MTSLADHINAALAKYPNASRDWLVREVLNTLDPNEYQDLLEQAIRTFYIPQTLNAERHKAQRDLTPSVYATTSASTVPGAKQAYVTSKKNKITQETRWQRYLDSRMNIDGVFREVKSLTALDLRIMADKNRAKAAQNTANAELHEKLATLVDTSGVATLGQVTEKQAEDAGVLEADLV